MKTEMTIRITRNLQQAFQPMTATSGDWQNDGRSYGRSYVCNNVRS